MSCENCEESAYVIDKLAKLLAEIAVIVNGPEPPLTRWSYHDLPAKVRALEQAPPAAAVSAEEAIEAAYWDFDARHKGYGPHKITPQSERDAFKWAVRALLAAAPAQQPAAAVPGYTEDEIADACMMAEVSDSKYVAIIAYLADNRRAMLAAARKGES